MERSAGDQIITTSVSDLIAERDELKRENENLRAENGSLRATILALKTIEQKYNDLVVWFTRKIKDD